MSSIDDLSFSINDTVLGQRAVYRARVSDLAVRVDNSAELLSVYDISAVGCSIQNSPEGFLKGRIVRLQVDVRGVPLVSGIDARVVRLKDDGSVACVFQRLNRQQELALDKLVLEIQKSLISQKKI